MAYALSSPLRPDLVWRHRSASIGGGVACHEHGELIETLSMSVVIDRHCPTELVVYAERGLGRFWQRSGVGDI